jgi:hypothetical protein
MDGKGFNINFVMIHDLALSEISPSRATSSPNGAASSSGITLWMFSSCSCCEQIGQVKSQTKRPNMKAIRGFCYAPLMASCVFLPKIQLLLSRDDS